MQRLYSHFERQFDCSHKAKYNLAYYRIDPQVLKSKHQGEASLEANANLEINPHIHKEGETVSGMPTHKFDTPKKYQTPWKSGNACT